MKNKEFKKIVLNVSELAEILGLAVETIKNKLDNYQFLKFVHRNGKNPAYAITITPESIYLIKKLIIPTNRPTKAESCLQRFKIWLESEV